MSGEDTITFLRRVRSTTSPLRRADIQQAEIPVPKFHIGRVIIGYLILCFSLDYLFSLWGWKVSDKAVGNIATALVMCGTCYPLLVWILKSIFSRRILVDEYFRFPPGAQYWYGIILFWLAVLPFSLLFPSAFKALGFWNWALLFSGGFIIPFSFGFIKRSSAAISNVGTPTNDFGLYIGASTGIFGQLSHGASIKRGQKIVLGLPDAAQNILVLGGIGSGKTTRAIQPLLVQLLDQDSGGLIFDIKGDFKKAVEVIAKATGKEITIIGPEKTKMNLISGLSPEVAASFLKSALLLNSRGGSDPFWIDTAGELCKNALGVLSFFPKRYSLNDLHEYLFDAGIRGGVTDEAQEKLETLPDREKRLLKSYLSYYEIIFSEFDDKVQKGVNASVAQILSPFNHPDLVDAFCTDDSQAPSMEKVLDGTVYLVDMPLSRWGLGGKVAYNFIKLRFFNVMQRRNAESTWNQSRPVFFMCDEFQELVSANRDGLSDLNFWDKSRSSKCIGIISAQAVSSFYAALGQRDISDALLQNFRQKICFRTEDMRTIDLLNGLLGRVEIERKSSSAGETSTTGGQHNTKSANSSVSTSITERQVINPQLFRTLGQNQAVTLLSFGGVSADDVIECVPVFID